MPSHVALLSSSLRNGTGTGRTRTRWLACMSRRPHLVLFVLDVQGLLLAPIAVQMGQCLVPEVLLSGGSSTAIYRGLLKRYKACVLDLAVPRRAAGDKRAYERLETEPGLDKFVADPAGN